MLERWGRVLNRGRSREETVTVGERKGEIGRVGASGRMEARKPPSTATMRFSRRKRVLRGGDIACEGNELCVVIVVRLVWVMVSRDGKTADHGPGGERESFPVGSGGEGRVKREMGKKVELEGMRLLTQNKCIFDLFLNLPYQ